MQWLSHTIDKHRMKLKYIIALFISLGSFGYGLAQNNIFVQLYSGEIIYYKLADDPTITYSATELQIFAESGTPKTYPIEKVRNIQYTHPKGISIADGIATGLTVVYTVSGRYVTLIKEFDDISKLDLPMGIYILQSAEASKKIMMQ